MEIVYLCTRRIKERAPAFRVDTHFLLCARCLARCQIRKRNDMDEIIKTDDVQNLVVKLRGQDVLLDRDVATLYGVKTK